MFSFMKVEGWARSRGWARLRAWLEKEPDGGGGLAPLAHRLVFGCQLVQEGAQAGGQGWGMTVFGAEVEVKIAPT